MNDELLVLLCVQMKRFPAEMHLLMHRSAMQRQAHSLLISAVQRDPNGDDMLKAFCR